MLLDIYRKQGEDRYHGLIFFWVRDSYVYETELHLTSCVLSWVYIDKKRRSVDSRAGQQYFVLKYIRT